MFVKIHKSYRTVIALCDEDIIGKVFHDGKKQLDVRESFYKGESVDHDRAVEILKFQAMEDATFNIAGKESVAAALEAGVIKSEGVGEVDGVPFALALL